MWVKTKKVFLIGFIVLGLVSGLRISTALSADLVFNQALLKTGDQTVTHTVPAGKVWHITFIGSNNTRNGASYSLNGTTIDGIKASSSTTITFNLKPIASIWLPAGQTIKGVTGANWVFSGIEYTVQ
ncbi:MAG: hypothetical protein ACUZ8E_01800 [Candidatus Anammoxibacter sp.]